MDSRRSAFRIPEGAAIIIRELNKAGHEAYLVGGCVRDLFLSRTPGDWDITTSARPEQVKAIFRRTIDTGLKHGTVTVLLKGSQYEVTTYRLDGAYSDGRHPDDVTFTSDLAEDLKRRDFTINAMAWHPGEGVVDLFDGQGDLARGVIRCVGDARERFTEDALRILRAVRFAAQLGFAIDADTESALKVLAPNLVHVSRERVRVELEKMLLSAHPDKWAFLEGAGVLPYALPPSVFTLTEEEAEAADAALQQRVRTLREGIFANAPERECAVRLAVLTAAHPKSTEGLLRDLRYDNDTIRFTRMLSENLSRPLAPEGVCARQLLCDVTPEGITPLLAVREALGEDRTRLLAVRAECSRVLEAGEPYCLGMLAVNGNDLMKECGIRGKAVGDTLKALLAHVIVKPADNERERLLQLAEEMSS